MPLTRIYHQGDIRLHEKCHLSREASHHLIHVLRIKVSDRLVLFNGEGSEYLAEVCAVEKRSVCVEIMEERYEQRESPLIVELAQGISRGERMDYAIQKAVELGVKSITPLFTERCGVTLSTDRIERRMQHWRGIIISACEQSGRLKIPVLHFPMDLMQWFSLKREGYQFMCAPEVAPFSPQEKMPEKITLLIGPEGGFSPSEITLGVKHGFQAICLGPRILRTETAAVVALTTVQLLWGDMMKR